ncbi:hypothetical protein BLOT_003224 [Blomia tropicalis]|nr:hypothetical protein BLOT_003224 [Blomia tropicalis]
MNETIGGREPLHSQKIFTQNSNQLHRSIDRLRVMLGKYRHIFTVRSNKCLQNGRKLSIRYRNECNPSKPILNDDLSQSLYTLSIYNAFNSIN